MAIVVIEEMLGGLDEVKDAWKRNKFVCSYDFCDRLPHQNSEGGSLYYGVRITRHRREGRCQ